MSHSSFSEKRYIGADVSKENIDFFDDQTGKYSTIKNDKTALKKFIKTIKSQAIIVFEATGGYERKLSNLLAEFKQHQRLRVHPACVKSFARALGTKAKTDKIDAYMLATAAKTIKDSFFDTTPPQEVQELRDVISHQKQLETTLHAEKCRLKMDDLCTFIKQKIQKHIRFLERQMTDIQSEMLKIVQKNQDLNAKYVHLQKVVGVGPVIAVSILAFLPELGKVDRKQVASLAGLAPNTRQSGAKTGRAYTMGGRQLLKKALYMGALVGTRHNKVLQEFYQRLVENGRPKMVAMIATARKLLIYLNAQEKQRICGAADCTNGASS